MDPKNVELMQVAGELALPARPRPRFYLTSAEAIPHRPVEVVTDEERRYEEQLEPKAELPEDYFYKTSRVDPPIAPGFEVNLETLLGFLEAMGQILPPKSSYPILSSVKIWRPPVEETGDGTLYLEGGSHSVWTLVAIKGHAQVEKGFTAMLPVRRAANVLKVLRDDCPKAVLGVDDHGVCIGPYTVPFGGDIDDFPARPTPRDWIARAAMPAAYFKEVCDRVLLVRSESFSDAALHGVLFDFEFAELDGRQVPTCTVVASDGRRIHILRLPRMMLDVKQVRLRALPPTCTVSAGFFTYLQAVIQHEWAALEFGADQIVARGEDFMVIAHAPAETKTSSVLAGWRRFDREWDGYWLVSKEKLDQVLLYAMLGGSAETCRLQVNGAQQTLTVSSENDAGDRYKEAVSARTFSGAPVVDAMFNIRYLRDAAVATRGGLVRLAFDRDTKTQEKSPLVVRGEDDQFKAIIMPVTEGEP